MFKKIVGLGFPSTGKNKKNVETHISELVESGAGEFFTGYNPAYWSDIFGFEVSPNGRFAEHEQITDIETLKAVVKTVHFYNLEIFVNLNAWYYTDETFPYIEKMYEEFIELWVDGIICGNIWILEYLKEKDFKWKINISTILAVYNTHAIEFMLENYKINKIILSREITLKEIEHIVNTFPETEFEVFGEGDFCRYNNGLCYAEHKYGAKDICTVVVNDLIVKKIYKADFKKIILDKTLHDEEKLQHLDDSYQDLFDQIEHIFENILLWEIEQSTAKEKLYRIVRQSKGRIDLFFDGQKPLSDGHNQNVLSFLKALKFINQNTSEQTFLSLQLEIEESFKSGMKYLSDTMKQKGGLQKVRADELASFYAKSDNLNLYSYLFFSRFPNINTVKFPTRWRSYAEKIQLIEKVLQDGSVAPELLDRWVSLERAHYDLTYLFGDTLWFRDLLQKI